MKSMIVVGGTGRGKTTFIKNEILAHVKNPIIYDINNEYYDKDYILPEMGEFIEKVKQVKNKLFVFEEATSFFDHSERTAKEMKKLLTRKRHTNRSFIYVFHALHQVPISILSHIDTFVLFKTNENPTLVKAKFRHFDRLIEPYNRIYENSDPYYKEIF